MRCRLMELTIFDEETDGEKKKDENERESQAAWASRDGMLAIFCVQVAAGEGSLFWKIFFKAEPVKSDTYDDVLSILSTLFWF